MQELALADITLAQGNRRGRAAVCCQLQLLIAGECKTMGKKAVEVAEDGTSNAAGTHHCNREGKC